MLIGAQYFNYFNRSILSFSSSLHGPGFNPPLPKGDGNHLKVISVGTRPSASGAKPPKPPA